MAQQSPGQKHPEKPQFEQVSQRMEDRYAETAKMAVLDRMSLEKQLKEHTEQIDPQSYQSYQEAFSRLRARMKTEDLTKPLEETFELPDNRKVLLRAELDNRENLIMTTYVEIEDFLSWAKQDKPQS